MFNIKHAFTYVSTFKLCSFVVSKGDKTKEPFLKFLFFSLDIYLTLRFFFYTNASLVKKAKEIDKTRRAINIHKIFR